MRDTPQFESVITRRKEWLEPEYPHRGIPTLDDGATDHRGRKWPITGCRCNACLSTAGNASVDYAENRHELSSKSA